jgi:hypothetical protein
MKNIIVTIGEILLGAALFVLIFGDTGSIKAEASRIFTDAITTMHNVKP